MRHLDDLEQQILTGKPVDLNRVSQLQVLDLLRLGHDHATATINRQSQADDLLEKELSNDRPEPGPK